MRTMWRTATAILCLISSISGASGVGWAHWSSWSRCSRTCSQGIQYRIRHCQISGTGGCVGRWWEFRTCYVRYTCTTTIATTTSTTTTMSTTITTTTTKPSTASTTTAAVSQSCYDPSDKESYRGTISKTETGFTCQAWNSQFPHQHKFTTHNYPTSDLNANHCRNPDKDTRPWCFAISTTTQWDFCNVPECTGQEPSSTTSSTTTQTPAQTSVCGIPEVPMSDEARVEIVGGAVAARGSIPWQASLRRSSSGSHLCGASLINENWIMTAAHCVTEPYDPSSYFAILGDHFQFTIDHTEQRVDFSVIFRHERFNSYTLENDVTLMKTTTPVTYNDYVKPICLPATNSILPNNELVTVSGWGLTKGTGSNAALNRASIPVIENSRCANMISGIFSKMLCAGYVEGGTDSCQGDSGGPLSWKSDHGVFQQVGIVSWGNGCAKPNNPGVYTRVSNYVSWINNIIRSN